MPALIAPDQTEATARIALDDTLTVWIDAYGRLQFDIVIDERPYYALRARLARRTLKQELAEGGEPFGPQHVRNRAMLFERFVAGSPCPAKWRTEIDRLKRTKEALFDQYRDAQRRAKAWYQSQLETTLAAD